MVDKGLDGRGIYRSIYVSIWNDPDFKQLSPETKLILLNLRTSPLSNLAVIYPYYIEAIERQTGLTQDLIQPALDTLCNTHWIAIEEGIVWVKHGLRYDPNIVLHNEKHKKAIINTILGLPKLQIVRDFIDFYKLDIPYPIPPTIPYNIPYDIHKKDTIRKQEGNKKEESVRETKDLISSLSSKLQTPSKTLDPISRKAELKRQAQELLKKGT